MRRHLSIIGITCALIVSGWGGVLAAAFCPHARHAAGGAALMSDQSPGDAHACCPISKKSADEDGDGHCSGAAQKRDDASTHNAASSHHEASGPTPDLVAEPRSRRVVAGFAFETSPCGHCVSRREQLPAFVQTRASAEAKRDINLSTVRVPRMWRAGVPSLSPVASLPRGAPPVGARRHVLMSVFLI